MARNSSTKPKKIFFRYNTEKRETPQQLGITFIIYIICTRVHIITKSQVNHFNIIEIEEFLAEHY